MVNEADFPIDVNGATVTALATATTGRPEDPAPTDAPVTITYQSSGSGTSKIYYADPSDSTTNYAYYVAAAGNAAWGTITGAIPTSPALSSVTEAELGDGVADSSPGTLPDPRPDMAVETMPPPPPVITPVSISSGRSHTCVVTTFGTASPPNGNTYCWGQGDSGRLGNGAEGNQPTPVKVLQTGTTGNAVTGYTAVAAGERHTCAITPAPARNVQCWGANVSGQLGDGTRLERLNPVFVLLSGTSQTSSPKLSDARAITAGDKFTCAIIGTAGNVMCWGDNAYAQLGDGTTTRSSHPRFVLTSGSTQGTSPKFAGAEKINAAVGTNGGGAHTCAIAGAMLAVWCWGANELGQLGDDTNDNIRRNPVRAGSLVGAQFVATGGHSFLSLSGNRYRPQAGHSCAVTLGQRVSCWGHDANGKLGNGSSRGSTKEPDLLTLTSVLEVYAGHQHTCSLSIGDSIHCWGEGSLGRLATTFSSDRTSPTSVSGLSNVLSMSLGEDFTCAIITGTTPGYRCWGSQTFGKLGNGMTSGSRNSPNAVLSFPA